MSLETENCFQSADMKPDLSSVPLSPYVPNGFTNEEKISQIELHFAKILETLGLDLTDDSIQQTPKRYAKMLVNEIFVGLNEREFPKITTQQNKFGYSQMVIELNIAIRSVCEHHFVPILGYCHIAYIPNTKIIGLSKLNRLAQYYASRPQVQERLTKQIKESISSILETDSVAVVIDALHTCVRMRGVKDAEALTRTSDIGGKFLEIQQHYEFFNTIPSLQNIKI